ncbi:tRNAHis guanylyltransferase-domain-containing protein [Gorgonomyces haynaldii]|nr:tRNAHis guanylyltransferase-domain-containing protein [Gorgonomyces haynaldii]
MALSKFEYVKHFEQHTTLLKNTFVVVRIDGHSFHRFTKEHNFQKPNDRRCIDLMNACAQEVMYAFEDIVIGYGQSDEYSFLFKRSSSLYQRREAKIISNLCSLFTAHYVSKWHHYFDTPLIYPPSFDSRAVCYPTLKNVRDYFSWRQADCHINNLYNTCFWQLVQSKTDPKTEQEAEKILKDTDSALKNELLFTKFGINYSKIEAVYRKGSTLYRKKMDIQETTKSGQSVTRKRTRVVVDDCDIIGDSFWQERQLEE